MIKSLFILLLSITLISCKIQNHLKENKAWFSSYYTTELYNQLQPFDSIYLENYTFNYPAQNASTFKMTGDLLVTDIENKGFYFTKLGSWCSVLENDTVDVSQHNRELGLISLKRFAYDNTTRVIFKQERVLENGRIIEEQMYYKKDGSVKKVKYYEIKRGMHEKYFNLETRSRIRL